MKPSGYILTGLRKHRARAHAPIILNHSLKNDWSGIHEEELLQAVFSNYESFNVCPVTRSALNKIIRLRVKAPYKDVTIDDFSLVPCTSKDVTPLLCTETDFFIFKAVEAITLRPALAVRFLSARVFQWRGFMEKTVLIAFLLLTASGCETPTFDNGLVKVDRVLYASSLIYDAHAAPLDDKSAFIIDPKAPAVRASHFAWR